MPARLRHLRRLGKEAVRRLSVRRERLDTGAMETLPRAWVQRAKGSAESRRLRCLPWRGADSGAASLSDVRRHQDHDVLALQGDGEVFDRRSEEHTSELQSPDHLVCRLLLEKKKPNS